MRDKYLNKIKSLKSTHLTIDFLHSVRRLQPLKCCFFFTYLLSIVYLSDPSKIWRTDVDLNSFLFYSLAIILIVGFCYLLNSNIILKKIELLLFPYQIKFDLMSIFYTFSLAAGILGVFFIVFYFTGIKIIHSTIYFLYFYNIAYLYRHCNSYDESSNKKNNNFYIRLSFLSIFIILFFLSILWVQNDALILTSILCLSPFYIPIIVSEKNELIFMLYRVSFFIILFFLATTIFPYLFIAALILMWIGKFYYFFKHNAKFPSFLNNYDNN